MNNTTALVLTQPAPEVGYITTLLVLSFLTQGVARMYAFGIAFQLANKRPGLDLSDWAAIAAAKAWCCIRSEGDRRSAPRSANPATQKTFRF